jgi:hypothetical protein
LSLGATLGVVLGATLGVVLGATLGVVLGVVLGATLGVVLGATLGVVLGVVLGVALGSAGVVGLTILVLFPFLVFLLVIVLKSCFAPSTYLFAMMIITSNNIFVV